MNTLHLGFPQGLLIATALLSLTVSAGKHGEPKTAPNDRVNFPLALMRWTILFALLLWGGFFA